MPYDTRQHEQQIIEALLNSYPGGLKTLEIADMVGTTQQTVRNHLDRLSELGVPVQKLDGNRYIIDPSDYLRPLRLTLAQAWLLYLPLRRIVRANLNRYALVDSLLRRIASSLLPEIADQVIPADTPEMTEGDALLTTLVEAWQRQLCVRLQYRPPDATTPSTFVIALWWFEPAVWSDSNYVIGGLQHGKDYQPITLKLERIQSARLTDTPFQRPLSDEILRRINQTWGIWIGVGAPERVVLRFHNRQYDRLRETRWHPSEEIKLDTDGSILWSALISEPQEMMPWIRGWGADVEVLEPIHIREAVATEAERTARLYGREPRGRQSYF